MIDLKSAECCQTGLLGLLQIVQQTAETLDSLQQVGQTGSVKILDMEMSADMLCCALHFKALVRHRLDERFQMFFQKG